MKVAVIGSGHVGLTVFRELQAFREIHELVLVGREEDAKICEAEAEDYLDAIPLRLNMTRNIRGGGYELAEGADILVYCAGPSVKAGGTEDLLAIIGANIKAVKDVFAEVDKYAQDAIVVVISNPLDVITTAIQKITGRPAGRVIGTGTLLDTARMIKIVSWIYQVSTDDVSGYVLGEHGATAVGILSNLRIMNMHHEEYLHLVCNGILPINGKRLNDEIRDAGWKIFRGKGYTSAGVAAAAARIVFDIINDRNEILPVSTVLNGEYGTYDIAMSVPCQIGREGFVSIKKISMTDEEAEALQKSADYISEACREAGF